MKAGTKGMIKGILGTTRGHFETQLAGLSSEEIEAIRDFFGAAAENQYAGGEKTPEQILWMLNAKFYAGAIEMGKL